MLLYSNEYPQHNCFHGGAHLSRNPQHMFSWRGTSNKYLQYMFSWRGTSNDYPQRFHGEKKNIILIFSDSCRPRLDVAEFCHLSSGV